MLPDEKPRRIAIIGCGGAGKSTLARELGERLDLPVHHLDTIFWLPGWQELDSETYKDRQLEILKEETWIIDGNYSGTFHLRFPAAELIIFLDLPTWRCLVGIVWRYLTYRGRTRPDMTEGNHERLEWDFVSWVWGYRRMSRPRVVSRLKEHASEEKVVRLTSRRAVRRFVAELTREAE